MSKIVASVTAARSSNYYKRECKAHYDTYYGSKTFDYGDIFSIMSGVKVIIGL